ncbi:uncharacterized protein LOC117693616 [Arvicanthis niloticus]|uniref:uncharacterized protein LOC117693616 n=1 Tax=Arvicanthis niloticus TaxID=61156 RepID=UPI00403C5D23
MGRWRWMWREFLRARSPSPAPRGLAEPARRRHSRPSPSRSPSSSWLRMKCPARVRALRTATIRRRDPTARGGRARDCMARKVTDSKATAAESRRFQTTGSYQRTKPLVERRREKRAGRRPHCLATKWIDHLFRSPGSG